MTKLELFLILFTFDCPKYILIPKTNNLLKHTMDIGKSFLVAGMLVIHGFLGWDFE